MSAPILTDEPTVILPKGAWHVLVGDRTACGLDAADGVRFPAEPTRRISCHRCAVIEC